MAWEAMAQKSVHSFFYKKGVYKKPRLRVVKKEEQIKKIGQAGLKGYLE